jgi:hypothetical protein
MAKDDNGVGEADLPKGRVRTARRLREHISSNIVGLVALFFALSGAAYALPGVNTVDSGDIIDNAVLSRDIRDDIIRSRDLADDSAQGIDVRDNSLTGDDIDESTLDVDESTLAAVPNANALGGVGASGYQRRCLAGSVAGWALIDGDNLSIAAAYGSTGVSASFNCPSGAATVRRIATGVFGVCFPDNFPNIAFTSPVGVNSAGRDNLVSWARLSDAGCPGGAAVEVRVLDNDGTTLQNERFSVELLH